MGDDQYLESRSLVYYPSPTAHTQITHHDLKVDQSEES